AHEPDLPPLAELVSVLTLAVQAPEPAGADKADARGPLGEPDHRYQHARMVPAPGVAREETSFRPQFVQGPRVDDVAVFGPFDISRPVGEECADVAQPGFLHDAAGGGVHRHRRGGDAVVTVSVTAAVEVLECAPNQRPCTFCRISSAPHRGTQPVSEFKSGK